MGSIRRYVRGNVVRDRKGESVHSEENEEKCDRCSSFLTMRGTVWSDYLIGAQWFGRCSCLCAMSTTLNFTQMNGTHIEGVEENFAHSGAMAGFHPKHDFLD